MDKITANNRFEYREFLLAIQNRVVTARVNFAKQVNREANALYWFIGKTIVANQKKQGWGKSVVEQLSSDLKSKFPDVKFGFSERNLWNMRQFYTEYAGNEKLQRLAAEIGWSSNLLIINGIKGECAREYYLRAVIEQGWTRDTLRLQIKSQAYERHCLNQKSHNFAQALPRHLADQAEKSLKSIYSLEMLGIAKPVLENELRRRMLAKIKNVLFEFGQGFAFIGDEYRIVAPNGRENFIDILCFNRILRSIVVIELKTGRFQPEYAGKMNYYLNLVDAELKQADENPSIGIILCAEKDHVDVEFSLAGMNKPIGVSGYQLAKDLPENIIDKLPKPEKLREEILKEMEL